MRSLKKIVLHIRKLMQNLHHTERINQNREWIIIQPKTENKSQIKAQDLKLHLTVTSHGREEPDPAPSDPLRWTTFVDERRGWRFGITRHEAISATLVSASLRRRIVRIRIEPVDQTEWIVDAKYMDTLDWNGNARAVVAWLPWRTRRGSRNWRRSREKKQRRSNCSFFRTRKRWQCHCSFQ